MVILGDHVTTDSGTGIVHTAPGFGEDDYNVGIANGLEVAVTVDERGIMMANAGPEFEGQFYDKSAKKSWMLLIKLNSIQNGVKYVYII
ncbi:isoleucyl-tRNA synthetase [Streptococcus pneumoniae]|nr:isoleucyl-tRNA synthetase [Streptococcus pneumoniae]